MKSSVNVIVIGNNYFTDNAIKLISMKYNIGNTYRSILSSTTLLEIVESAKIPTLVVVGYGEDKDKEPILYNKEIRIILNNLSRVNNKDLQLISFGDGSYNLLNKIGVSVVRGKQKVKRDTVVSSFNLRGEELSTADSIFEIENTFNHGVYNIKEDITIVAKNIYRASAKYRDRITRRVVKRQSVIEYNVLKFNNYDITVFQYCLPKTNLLKNLTLQYI